MGSLHSLPCVRPARPCPAPRGGRLSPRRASTDPPPGRPATSSSTARSPSPAVPRLLRAGPQTRPAARGGVPQPPAALRTPPERLHSSRTAAEAIALPVRGCDPADQYAHGLAAAAVRLRSGLPFRTPHPGAPDQAPAALATLPGHDPAGRARHLPWRADVCECCPRCACCARGTSLGEGTGARAVWGSRCACVCACVCACACVRAAPLPRPARLDAATPGRRAAVPLPLCRRAAVLATSCVWRHPRQGPTAALWRQHNGRRPRPGAIASPQRRAGARSCWAHHRDPCPTHRAPRPWPTPGTPHYHNARPNTATLAAALSAAASTATRPVPDAPHLAPRAPHARPSPRAPRPPARS